MKDGLFPRFKQGKIIIPTASFLLVLLTHFTYLFWETVRLSSEWFQVKEINPLRKYFERQDIFIGLSYALTAAFTAYAVINFFDKRKRGIAGTVGGFTLAGVLYFAGCFLTGCCGSPMLTVYLSLFGSSIIGFAKPITAGFTFVSIVIGFIWINKNNKANMCSDNEDCCNPQNPSKENLKTTDGLMKAQDEEEFNLSKMINDVDKHEVINKIRSEIEEGINLLKCQQCGCMKDTLEKIKADFPTDVDKWQNKIIPVKYTCHGCEHCYPAVAMNLFNEAYPEKANSKSDCAIEVREDKWPYVAGEYYTFCGGDYCPVAVSTLGDSELAEKLSKNHPKELCIVGKTETENIGIDKVIKNTVTNPTIKYLLLVGQEPKGHKSGETFLSLSKNGVDEKMRVIGSTGKKPVLRNVSVEEINSFRNQVEVVDMIGCNDETLIVDKIKELASKANINVSKFSFIEKSNSSSKKTTCGCKECNDEIVVDEKVIQAKEPTNIIMDKAGYFVILPIPEKNIISVEHYSYDNNLLRTIEGKDARSIYWTIVENDWVTLLSHAAYLGKELEKAELSLKLGSKYIQDGA